VRPPLARWTFPAPDPRLVELAGDVTVPVVVPDVEERVVVAVAPPEMLPPLVVVDVFSPLIGPEGAMYD
jgi:hypothetical protein